MVLHYIIIHFTVTDDLKKPRSDVVSCGDNNKEHDNKIAGVAKIIDPVQKALGDFGWWQFWITFALSLLKFPIAWHQLAIIFLAAKTQFRCDVDGETALFNVTDKCHSHDPITHNVVPCQQFSYDRSVFQETIITEVSISIPRLKRIPTIFDRG